MNALADTIYVGGIVTVLLIIFLVVAIIYFARRS